MSDETLVVEGLLDFVDKEVAPLQEQLGELFENPRLRYEESGREAAAVLDVRREVRQRSAAAGYYTAFCPENIGGGGLGERQEFLSWEALHRRYGPGHLLMYDAISHWTSGPSPIWSQASTGLRRDVLPELMSGRLSGSFGMSEPDAGTDAWRMKTTAKRDGDDWLLNGSKQWTSFSPTADFVMTFAVTDNAMREERKGGITCFYVPTKSPGFAVESVIKLFGEIGGHEGILSYEDVRVSDEYRIGEVNSGFALAMLGSTRGRFYNTARSVGLSRWALEKSVAYAQVRWAGGKPIGQHQSIQNMLADCAVEIYAARMMGLACASKAETGVDIRRDAAMAKLYATNAAGRVMDRAMQVHGGMGLTNEMRFYEGWKTARIIQIGDGTNEILRQTIAKSLLRGDLSF